MRSRTLKGLALALLLTSLAQAPATAETGAGPDLLLENRGQPPAVLVPGSTSTWTLGVTTVGVEAGALSLRLSGAGPLTDAMPPGHVTVQVSACPGRWTADSCPAGETAVIPRTSLGSLDGTARSLAEPGGRIPAGVELRIAVTLSPAAGNEVQGLSAQLTARVDAAEAAGQTGPDGGTPPGGKVPDGGLPDTGWRLGALALLGAAAAAAGIAAAAFARRMAPAPGKVQA
ncbi:hypothetical protein BIU82_15575 [Arthrobacter sp. SW1]|nr:hypothetical protein BIU82_15575 [Arthrobacter sp. SW1]